ncbi:MAG: hypothetical protein GX096_09135 [Clostridiales bacterium]|nr:hypothetical protein [Clostridiales bacterium]
MMNPFIFELIPGMGCVDFTGHWQPGAIFRAMQDAGEGHCRELHLTFEELREQGLAWVITRAHVQMDEYPTLGETITVKTWPGVTRRMFFPRNFVFEVGGKEMGRASMVYVLLDLETRTIAQPSRLKDGIPVYDIPAPLPFPGSIKNFQAEQQMIQHKPIYMDVDMNGHVNNTRYVDWFMNAIPLEKHAQEQITNLLVHFTHEITPQETITLTMKEQEDVSVMHGMRDDTICFSVEGTWKKRA